LVALAHASADPKLLSLVPPDAALVAGISASSFGGQPNNFVLLTGKNRADLADFYSLTGGDDTRRIHQAIFVALFDNRGLLSEHSLLVSGHFDQSRLFKSATNRGFVTSYRTIPILEIQPLARERDKFYDVRWVAVLDSSVLVFGSIASIRLELDRYSAHSHPNESLLHRLARLRSKDQTWCVLSGAVGKLSYLASEKEIRTVLTDVNPQLADLALSANEFEFGIFYGRQVEFEYEVTLASSAEGHVSPDSFRPSPIELSRNTSLLPSPNTTGHADTLHEMFKISTSRYEAWLTDIERPPVD
jgi:hypothetical protein